MYCFFSTVQILSSAPSSASSDKYVNAAVFEVVRALQKADSIALGACNKKVQEQCAEALMCMGTKDALEIAVGIYHRHLNLPKQIECADRFEALGTPEALEAAGKIRRYAGGRGPVLDGSRGAGGAASGGGAALKTERLEEE